MERANIGRAILAGFIATLVMTLLMFMAPMMGMPKMDTAGMLGSMLHGGQPPAPMSSLWWVGMIIHFMMGTILFPLIYAYLLYTLLPGPPWAKGLLWGLILWFLLMVAVMPMMGKGFFAANMPQSTLFAIGALIGHIVYGILLGAIAGPQATRLPQPGPSARIAPQGPGV